MLKKIAVTAAILCTTTMGCAIAQTPATVAETGKGKTLVDSKGMTLYTFDKDADGKSACNGQCAKNWPPLAVVAEPAGAGTAGWTVVKRDDDTKQ